MPKRIKSFYQRHQIISLIFFVSTVPVLLFLFYCGWVMASAAIDTPKVVTRATAPDKIVLRLEDVPDDFQNILLAVEDPNFYSHNGLDLSTPGAGWTTITQGLVKVYFYNGFTPGTFRYRKFEQTLIAWVFNRQVNKKTQLLIFINSVYFGEHQGREVIGFSDASKSYFNKDFSALTKDEFTALVAMIIGPNEFHIIRQPDKNKERVNRINHLLSGECKPGGFTDVYYENCS